MRVEFRRREDGGSLALVDRDDGVRLQLRSYDRTGEVPHDAVHLVAERALAMADGLWGSIAAGALFPSVEVVSGRQRHDRRTRSDEIRRRNADQLHVAETVVGVLQHEIDRDAQAATTRLDRAWGITHVGSSPFTVAQVTRALGELRTMRAGWKRLPPGAPGPVFSWPSSLVSRSGSAGRPGRGRR